MSRSAARRRRACAAARTFSRSTTSSCIGSERERARARRAARALLPRSRSELLAASRALAQLLPRFRPAEPGAALEVLHEIERQAPGSGAQGQGDLLLLRPAPSPARERGLPHRRVGDDVPRPGACPAARARSRRRGSVRASARSVSLRGGSGERALFSRARARRGAARLSRTDARGGVPPVPRRVPAVPAVPRRVAVRVHVRPHGARLPARAREGDEVQLLRQREL